MRGIHRRPRNSPYKGTVMRIMFPFDDVIIGQLPPKTLEILTKVFCTFDPNLVILAWTDDELLCGPAQNGVSFDFRLKFDLEGQGRLLPQTTGTPNKVFHTCGSNLVILAWTSDELSRGQARDYRTPWRTDRQTQAGNNTTFKTGVNSIYVYGVKVPYKFGIVVKPADSQSHTTSSLISSTVLIHLAVEIWLAIPKWHQLPYHAVVQGYLNQFIICLIFVVRNLSQET